jgi:hypothetical protein
MIIAHYIRILGHHHATHHHGTVLGVVDTDGLVAASNGYLVHRDHADELVKQGHAEWVHSTSSPTPPASESLHERHAEEHADMLSRHATEHREMRERHEAEHNEAIAALGVTAAVTGL